MRKGLIKNERGVITIITLVTILFMLAFLLSTFVIVINRRQAQAEVKTKTQELYEGEIENIENIYANIIGKIIPENAGKYYAENGDYSDGNKTAKIPAGFTVSGAPTEYTIDDGLVIYLIDDMDEAEIKNIKWNDKETLAQLQENYDQFVWIPIPRENINDMYMCQSKTSSTTCNISINSSGEAYCSTHSSTAMAGRLYASSTGNNYTPTLTNQTYNANSALREPAVITGSSSGDGIEYEGSPTYLSQLNKMLGTSYSIPGNFKTDLQDEYNEIVKSVYQNEGFYIGRYETSGMKNSDTNATIKVVAGSDNTTNSNISEVTWYRMYAQQKKYASNKGLTESIGSTMIQGAAYDQVMKFIDPTTSFVQTTGRVGQISSQFTQKPYETGNTNYSSVYTGTVTYNDIAKNIYDLEGNVQVWTTEAYDAARRVTRGGSYDGGSSGRSLSYRDGYFPDSAPTNIGSICQLYIKPE